MAKKERINSEYTPKDRIEKAEINGELGKIKDSRPDTFIAGRPPTPKTPKKK